MPNQHTGPIPIMTRFWQHVRSTESCWLWIGRRGVPVPYARVHIGSNRYVLAHRLSYEFHVGRIPDGMEIDHLCRTPACVNPGHLEPVTAGENVLRGVGFTAVNARKTHCPRGHALTTRKRGAGLRRSCKTCGAEQALRRYHRLKADRPPQSGPKELK